MNMIIMQYKSNLLLDILLPSDNPKSMTSANPTEMSPLEYIQKRPALNHRELCRLIEWSPSSFNQWMKGNRGIPKEKNEALKTVLQDYGY